MAMKHTEVILNGVVDKHLLEDAPAIAVYHINPSEPDVGFMEEYIDLCWVESRAGRVLETMTRRMTQGMWDHIIDQINDKRLFR
jgi:hypothetical protein